jgi:hypothetical protein
LQVQDNISWGVVGYSVKEGHKAPLLQTTLPTRSTMWRNILKNDGLPKINIFCWILSLGKLLTGGNLTKTWFQGPFHCALFYKNLEIYQHLFLECDFSKQVWKLVYKELLQKIVWPSNYKTLLGKWGRFYRVSFHGNVVFQRVWKASPKYVCWQLWLAINKVILKNKHSIPSSVATHSLGLMAK